MTIGFSTKWPDRMGELAGKPNCFPEKILSGMLKELEQNKNGSFLTVPKYIYDYGMFAGILCSVDATKPKLTTIREDLHNRWKPGIDIHFVINNRTKDRFQFAPVIKCKSVQTIEILHTLGHALVKIDGEFFGEIYHYGFDDIHEYTNDLEVLVINDGFPSIDAFFQYFNEDFKGKLIHWADLKY